MFGNNFGMNFGNHFGMATGAKSGLDGAAAHSSFPFFANPFGQFLSQWAGLSDPLALARTMTAMTDTMHAAFDQANRLADLHRTHLARIMHEHTGEAIDRFNALSNLAARPQDGMQLLAATGAYLVDAAQRMVLTADVLRERGNAFLESEKDGNPPVLDFAYETVIDGRALPRPVNYSLVKITPPADAPTKDDQQPIVIIDPRAGHGAGIGGFKPESQVGVALERGHPVYFVVFRPRPEPGQTLADVTEAEGAFLRAITARHPEAPRPVVVGNCQGGWASMLLAAANPADVGPLVINGAPMSYWAGETGRNPMRYLGGLFGGVLPALILSDLGNGVFDGAHLVSNFEGLNPANSFFSKTYNLYANVDSEGPRYLEFERWWSGFFYMNEAEIRWIVENLFIGNKLGRGEAKLGRDVVDLGKIESPILVFASFGDNITPPQQALNWIPDVYASAQEIAAKGRKIVYMLHDSIGHLGIFVSGKIAGVQHAEITSTLDEIAALPPGLYEMVIDTRTKDEQGYSVKFEERQIEDLLGLDDGRSDELLFIPVARISHLLSEWYQLAARPLLRSLVTPASAEYFRLTQPMRVKRMVFSDKNPAMASVRLLAEMVRHNRRIADKDNPLRAFEGLLADGIAQGLNLYRDSRDAAYEFAFHAFYGAPAMQNFARESLIAENQERFANLRALPEVQAALGRIEHGGLAEAVVRMLVFQAQARGSMRRSRLDRGNRVLFGEEGALGLSIAERDRLVHEQNIIVDFEPERALATLPKLLPRPADRQRAIALVDQVLGPRAEQSHTTRALLSQFETILDVTPTPENELPITPPGGALRAAAKIAAPVATASAPAEVPTPVRESTPAPAARQAAGDAAPFSPRAPALLSAPEGGKADDLVLLKGVGPRIVDALNRIGVFHFAQIAGWSAAELAWVDGEIGANGRLIRENIVEQAKARLAA